MKFIEIPPYNTTCREIIGRAGKGGKGGTIGERRETGRFIKSESNQHANRRHAGA